MVTSNKISHTFIVSTLAGILLLTSACAPAKAEKLIFTSHSIGTNDTYVYSMNLDGNNLVKLAKCSLFYAQPFEMWSADGQKLAFIDPETEPGKTWLCVVDANRNNRRQLLEITDSIMSNFAFSMAPDGKKIVMSRDVSHIIETPEGGSVHVEVTHDSDIFKVDVASGLVKQLTDTPDVWEQHPSFSPDGKKIAFITRIDTEDEKNNPKYVYVMDANGSNRRLVGYHAKGMPFPLFQGFHWSPDSKKIAYSVFNMSTSDYENFTDIFIIDVDKGGLTNLSNSPYVVDTNPAWSPDGSKIAYFSGSLDEGSFTWIMDADGRNKTKLYQTGGPSSWTPDAKGLIFTNRLNVYEIMEMNTHGENRRSLVKIEDLKISEPAWIGQ